MTDNDDYDDHGYIYCVSNVSMPNILNIGITWMTPELRLKEINEMPGMWKPPTPYKCEFAKSVHNAGQKKEAIYKVLSQFRINPNYKFFRVSMEEVRTIFDLMDGDYWGGGVESGDVESGDVESCDVESGDVECGDIYDIPRATANDMDIDNILEKKNREIEKLNEIFQKREIEIKATEEKMLDCLFKKCDDLAANIEDKKADLAEINAIIEERKSELTNLSLIANVTTDSNTQTNSVNPVNHMITEY
jgi:hypothetical protein